ncbi:hypothetical protein PGT21_010955 [Puccinia graminis f. sp. tritici]|uniref:Uncharacterized protein n=1 Tax=Puccinia graminis f. sp. tritici TaxID=56615 RepID=A0A5B0PEK6_PUCGR|nr:hypothetical protein PGT21_010955 [Puccinia graminis f. sp. tritici]
MDYNSVLISAGNVRNKQDRVEEVRPHPPAFPSPLLPCGLLKVFKSLDAKAVEDSDPDGLSILSCSPQARRGQIGAPSPHLKKKLPSISLHLYYNVLSSHGIGGSSSDRTLSRSGWSAQVCCWVGYLSQSVGWLSPTYSQLIHSFPPCRSSSSSSNHPIIIIVTPKQFRLSLCLSENKQLHGWLSNLKKQTHDGP